MRGASPRWEVILFVGGTPVHRWIFDFNVGGYKTELDKVAGGGQSAGGQGGSGQVLRGSGGGSV